MPHHKLKRKITFSRQMLDLPGSIKLVSLIFLIYNLGWGIVEPYLALYFKEIFGTYSLVGIIFALLPLFAVVWALALGPLVNRVLKKHIISFVLFLYLPLGYILLSLSTFIQFIWFRIYHSFVATALWLSGESYLREHSEKKKEAQAYGIFYSARGITLVAGPIIGAFLIASLGWSIFYLISLSAMAALLLSFFLRDKAKENMVDGLRDVFVKDHFIKKEFSDFFKNKKLIKISTFLFFFVICIAFVWMLLPLFLREFGASYLQIGLVCALFNSPIILEAWFSTFAKKRWLVLTSLFLGALFFALMFMVESLVIIFALCFFLGLAISAIHPIVEGKLTTLMPKRKIGELTGVIFAIWCIAEAAGYFMAGIISDAVGLRYVFLIGCIIFLILGGLMTRKKIFGF